MKILFQGDSLTDCGRARDNDRPNLGLGDGYVNMICGELTGADPQAGYEVYNRAVSGNRIADMYARWIEDALNPEYDLLSILCGVNDVGFSLRLNRGSDAERFEFIYDRMLTEVRETHPKARIMLVEPFLFRFAHDDGPRGDDINRDWEIWGGELRKRGAAVRRLAKKHGAFFLPMFDHFETLSARFGAEHYSVDCIHLTPAGNYVLARRWLEAAREHAMI